MDYFRFQQALRLIEQKAIARNQSRLPGDRDVPHATLPAVDGKGAAWWHARAEAHQLAGDADKALAAWKQALLAGTDDLALLAGIGRSLRDAGSDPVAMARQASLEAGQDHPVRRQASGGPMLPEGWNDACLDVLGEAWRQALPVLDAIHLQFPHDRRHASNLAFVLEQMGDEGRAQCVLAANLLSRGKAKEAADMFMAAPARLSQSPRYLGRFLASLRGAGEEVELLAIANAAEAADMCPADARRQWVEALLDLQRDREAQDVLGRAVDSQGELRVRLQQGELLPAVPASQELMDRMHRAAHRAILSLDDQPLPTDESQRTELGNALEPNFYLAYLAEPVTQEIRAYGRFVERVMSAVLPHHATPIPKRRREPGARIRIGYATRGTSNLGVAMRYLAGWLQHADRANFELHLFPLECQHDWMSGYLSSLVDHYHEGSTDTETAARRIRDADLDILLYPEIGMDPLSMRLAALHLAPVQCVANGHPVSTGLATLDFFISNDAMEPPDASSHYTERLVTLPGIGLCLPPSPRPDGRKQRADFGLADDAIVYLSAQSAFKYLPRHDDVFARIAKAVDKAVFVFVEGHYPAWTRTLRDRLAASFAAHGLDPARHVHFVPRQDFEDFLCLNAASDVCLDPIGWSGGLTALDAISCEVPLVVLPGTLMRGRQSYGWLKQMGIENTIAGDIDAYVDIAVRLGMDNTWRADISRRMGERRHLLFDDPSCVKSLEAFFRSIAGTPLPGDEELFTRWPAPPRRTG